MSGGRFNYGQFQIGGVADQLRDILRGDYRGRTGDDHEDYWHLSEDWGTPGDCYFEDPKKMRRYIAIVQALTRLSADTVHGLDWYLSGDTGEEKFAREVESAMRVLRRVVDTYEARRGAEGES